MNKDSWWYIILFPVIIIILIILSAISFGEKQFNQFEGVKTEGIPSEDSLQQTNN